VAKRTLNDVVEALHDNTEYLNMIDDRFVKFFDELKTDRERAMLQAMEARAESSRQYGMTARALGQAARQQSAPASQQVDLKDVIKPSKEAGVLTALGALMKGPAGALLLGGVGIGAATGGIGYLLSQINDLGPSASRLAKGLEDLDNVDVSGEQFKKLGKAIADLIGGVGIFGAIGTKILAGAAFKDMAEGLERLNDVRINTSAFQDLGDGLRALTEDMGPIDAIATRIVSGTGFDNLAAGINVLNATEVSSDFAERMQRVGEGLDTLLSGTGGWFGNLIDATTMQMIDDNLGILGDGVNTLNNIPNLQNWVANADIIGSGLSTLLSETGGWFGNLIDATTLQSIDDNLKPMADGIDRLNKVDVNLWKTQAEGIGEGLGSVLDFGKFFTSEASSAAIIQMLDDNLIPLADAIDYIKKNVSDEELEHFKMFGDKVGDALNDLTKFGDTSAVKGADVIEMIDDNLIPLTDGLVYMTQQADKVSYEKIGGIVKGYNELAKMQTLTPGKLKGFSEMIREFGYPSISQQRISAIAEQTETTGGAGGGTVIVDASVKQSSSSSAILPASTPMPQATKHSGYRPDAYSM